MPWPLRVTLIVSLILFVIDLLIAWRLVRADQYVRIARRGRWGLLVLPLVFFIYPLGELLIFWLNGTVHYDGFPHALIYLFWWGLVFSVQLFILLLPVELIRLPIRSFWKLHRPELDRWYGWTVMLLAGFTFVYMGYRVYHDSTAIEVTQQEIRVDDLPRAFRGVKIVHLSDVQADRFTNKEKLQRMVDLVREQEPDLVVFTGDLVTEGTRFINLGARMMGKLDPPLGTIGVIGDHDFWAGKDLVIDALNKQGITMLEGENKKIPVNGDSLLISGITQVYSKKADPDSVKKLLDRADGDPVKLFISHQVAPWLIRMVNEHDYDALLAGHTHGGQIEFSFYGWPVSAPRMETDYVRGSYWYHSMLVHINRGIGFTLAPIRYRAAGQISVLTLSEKR